MELRQGDLFRNLNKDFIKQITELAEHLSCKKDDVLFKVGDPANFFYILLRGVVTMERGRGRWYTAKQPGELFGWSSLIHRTEFAASAVCDMDSEVLKIERAPFLKLLESSQQDKATLYEQLSRMIGSQLLNVYMNTAS
ncbi:MAG: cyclic nucleotide-binding domain-containing protein [Desulfobacteraceae bacterium]|nr:cyclic nucleotide-binding domain-containing protein [Desulfobacteraceae bacterium]